MKTSCPHCNKVYDIDDSKVPAASIQLRCSGCTQTFTYSKSESPAAQAGDEGEFWQPPTMNVDSSAVDSKQSSENSSSESSFEENSSIQALEPSIDAEFGTMDDLALDEPSQAPQPSVDDQAGSEKGSFELEHTSFADETSSTDLDATADLGGGSSDYWEQMQSLESDAVGKETDDGFLAAEESVAQEPPAADNVDDDALIASLKAEQQKVAAESRRLETVTAMFSGEYAPSPAEPNKPPAPPPPQLPPEPTDASPQPEGTTALPPENVLPLEEEDDGDEDLEDLLAEPVDEISSAEVSMPPVTRMEAKQPAAPPVNASVQQAVQVPIQPAAQQAVPPLPPSEVSKIKRKRRAKGKSSKAPIFVVAGIVAVASAGGFVYFKQQQNGIGDLAFESEALKAATGAKSEKVQVVALSEPSAAKGVKKPPKVKFEESGDPYDLGIAAFKRHDLEGYKQAEKHLMKAYKEEDKSPRTVLALSELYSTLGSVMQRKDLLRKGFDLAKKHLEDEEHGPRAMRATAWAYYYSRQYQQAFDYVQKSLAVDAGQSDSYLLRGLAMVKLGKGGGGLQQALKKAPDEFLPAYELAKYYLDTKKFSGAIKVGKKLTSNFPERYEGYATLMRGYAGTKNYSNAINQIDQATSLDPDDTDFYLDAAELYLKRGKSKSSAEILELFLVNREKLPRSDLSKVYLALGKAHLKTNPKKAAFYFDKLVKWDKKDVTALNYLGLSNFQQKQYKNAIKYFKKSRSLDPGKLEIDFNLGLAYYHGNYFKNSSQVFRSILSKKPKHEEANYYLAATYEKQGDRFKAIESLRRVLKINPNHKKARTKLKILKAGK